MSVAYSLDEVLAMAEQIERNGAAFYRAAAGQALDPEVKSALLELAAWEDGHEATFAGLRASLTDSELSLRAFDPDGEGEAYLRAIADNEVFGSTKPVDLLHGATDTRSLLTIALQFERDSILFFLGMRDAVPSRLGSASIDLLIDEERGHIAYLGRQLERLNNR